MANETTLVNQPNFLSYILGSSIALLSLPGWLGNLLIIALIGLGRMTKKGVIYYMIASLAVGDFIQLSLLIFYLAPSAAAQNWLIPMGAITVPGDIFCICWYHMWFMLIEIGINRYLAICHSQSSSPRVVKWGVLGAWIGGFLVWTHFFFIPCCRLYMAFPVYSLMLEPKGAMMVNWGDKIVEIPGNTITILLMIFCYGKILLHIRKSQNEVQSAITDLTTKRKMKTDIQMAWQFMAVSLCFSAVWIFFRLFPMIAGTEHFEVYVLISYMIILNSSVNPWIYLKYNTQMRNKLAQLRGDGEMNTTAGVVSSRAGIQHRNGNIYPVPKPAARRGVLASMNQASIHRTRHS